MTTHGNIPSSRYSGDFHSTLDMGQTKTAVRLGGEDALPLPSRVGNYLKYPDGRVEKIDSSVKTAPILWGQTMSQTTQAREVFQQWVERYRDKPALFVQEVLGVDPDVWQIDFLNAIARGDRRISVRSGHGVGKSTASSWAMLWFFMTRSPVKVVVTAPTSAQLFDALFAELKRWVNELPKPLQAMVTVKQDRIVLMPHLTRCLSPRVHQGPSSRRLCRASTRTTLCWWPMRRQACRRLCLRRPAARCLATQP